jgi:bacillopeptidase F (M6 metalloprotease family)
MGIIDKLNWDKPYGVVRGPSSDGIRYWQDNIGFDAQGGRVTPMVKEEMDAIAASGKAARLLQNAEAIRDKVIKKIAATAKPVEIEMTDAAALPLDFMEMSREDLINYARNHFGQELKGHLHYLRRKVREFCVEYPSRVQADEPPAA